MLKIVWKSQFKRDYKNAKKRGKKIDKLAHIIQELYLGRPLPLKNKNHKLVGNYTGCWECHIEGDWLLIYCLSSTTLILVRTGSHSDLF